MIQVGANGLNGANGINGANGANGHDIHPSEAQRRNPYAPRASDFLSNISNFSIIESTLRGMSYNSFALLP
jgi:homocitrate synthase